MSTIIKYAIIVVAVFTTLFILYDYVNNNNSNKYGSSESFKLTPRIMNTNEKNQTLYPRNMAKTEAMNVYHLRNNKDYPEITRGDFLDSSNYEAIGTERPQTLPKKETYLIRNPIKNPKLQSKNTCFDKNKSYIRDLDDGMIKAMHVPITNIECDFFGEKDNYKDSILRFEDSDEVDRINRFRLSNQNNFLGKDVSEIYDELSGNNDVKQNTDMLAREGTAFTPANKNFKVFNEDRWHYERENSINGGVILGSNGLRGYDKDYNNPALIY
jgi:hypothetical protein